MGDSGTSARYRFVPLDKSGLVCLGVDVTNGKQAALFVINQHEMHKIVGPIDAGDLLFHGLMMEFVAHNFEFADDDFHVSVRIEGKGYSSVPWDANLDRSLVSMLDRLIDMRMKNASVVSMVLQLEMPI